MTWLLLLTLSGTCMVCIRRMFFVLTQHKKKDHILEHIHLLLQFGSSANTAPTPKHIRKTPGYSHYKYNIKKESNTKKNMPYFMCGA